MTKNNILQLVLTLLTLNSSVAMSADLWNTMDKVLTADPYLKVIESRSEENVVRAQYVGERDEPQLEYIQAQRESFDGSSTVSSVVIRQKIDFEKSRKQDIYTTQSHVLNLGLAFQKRAREGELLKMLYRIDRIQQEIVHITERSKRIQHIKSSLEENNSNSPTRVLDKELVISLLRDAEVRLASLDSELNSKRTELQMKGWPVASIVPMKWLQATEFERATEIFSSAQSTSIESQLIDEEILRGKQRQLESQRTFSEVEFTVGYDQQNRGQKEKNILVGFTLPLPVGSLKNRERSLNIKDIETATLELQANQTTRTNDQELLKLSAKFIVSLLSRYNLSLISDAEKTSNEAERNLLKSRITLGQYLELDRRRQSDFEASFDAQERAINWILSSCRLQSCMSHIF